MHNQGRQPPILENIEHHPELPKILDAVHSVVMLGKSQKEVAESLGVSPSTVSRWVNTADEEWHLIRRHVDVPLVKSLATELEKPLQSLGIRRVFVAPASTADDANLANLGDAGAKALLEAIDEVNKEPDEPIRIALSCGRGIWSVIENVLSLLRLDDKYSHIRNRAIELYPTTFYDSYEIDSIFPHTIVTTLAARWRQLVRQPIERLQQPSNVAAFATTLTTGFYKFEPAARKSYLGKFGEGISSIERTVLDDMDIVVVGLGLFQDEGYQRILSHFPHQGIDARYATEVCFIPTDEEGRPHPEIESLVIGMTVTRLQELRLHKDRTIIALGAGSRKKGTINPLISYPCFNWLVTDTDVANEWLSAVP